MPVYNNLLGNEIDPENNPDLTQFGSSMSMGGSLSGAALPSDLFAQHTADLAQKFKYYQGQHEDALTKLKDYMQQYESNQHGGVDYRPLAAFIGGLPQHQNPQLAQMAQSIEEEKAQKAKGLMDTQTNIAKQYELLAKEAEKDKNLSGMMGAMYRQNRMGQIDAKEARTTMNNDSLLKQYNPRLEGAAKIGELITDALSGKPDKVVSNQALLGQVNAEIARLETGANNPGLHAAEKTELMDKGAQLYALRDSITGNPKDAVDPRVLVSAQKLVSELQKSYMKGIDARMAYLTAGMTPAQKKIAMDKQHTLRTTYAPRFKKGWEGLNSKETNEPNPATMSEEDLHKLSDKELQDLYNKHVGGK